MKWHDLPYNRHLKLRARELRKAGNLSEALLWNELKQRKFLGLEFDRQKIIGNYIVDFFCKDISLVIEIDGDSHADKLEYDRKRQRFMNNLGLAVIRFSSLDVKKNMNGVLNRLREEIENYSSPSTRNIKKNKSAR